MEKLLKFPDQKVTVTRDYLARTLRFLKEYEVYLTFQTSAKFDEERQWVIMEIERLLRSEKGD